MGVTRVFVELSGPRANGATELPRAREAKVGLLIGEFLPTAKNRPFARFYKSCGFDRSGANNELQRWTWPLETADISIPDWMRVIAQEQMEE